MAKKPQVTEAKAAKSVTKKINRTRRNAMERKCLPKALKWLFAGSTRSQFREILRSWEDSRKKVRVEA